jgi:hypothetical protein
MKGKIEALDKGYLITTDDKIPRFIKYGSNKLLEKEIDLLAKTIVTFHEKGVKND